jgi:hypothetical protein
MIIRRHITANYTVIPNEAILDCRLSISARWLLCYLLSRPHDWKVQIGDIQNQGGIGRDKAYALVKELIAARWVRKDESRQQDGRWSGVEYVVMDEPESEQVDSSPFPEKPYTAEPFPANQHLTNNGKKPKTEKKPNLLVDADFEEFWAAYPKRPNNPRKTAMAAYRKVRARSDVSQKQLLEAVSAYAASMLGKDTQYIAMASTWLNSERWTCDFAQAEKVIAAHQTAKYGGDLDIDPLVAVYPGTVIDRKDVARLAAATGAAPQTLEEAARKYALLLKQQRHKGLDIVAPPLETWLRFRWREMEAYEFCTSGMANKPAVRPKRERAA